MASTVTIFGWIVLQVYNHVDALTVARGPAVSMDVSAQHQGLWKIAVQQMHLIDRSILQGEIDYYRMDSTRVKPETF